MYREGIKLEQELLSLDTRILLDNRSKVLDFQLDHRNQKGKQLGRKYLVKDNSYQVGNCCNRFDQHCFGKFQGDISMH